MHIPGAKANTAKHSPVEATAVTIERLLSKYCDRMVTVGRKLKQYPKPVGKIKGPVRTRHGRSPEGTVREHGGWGWGLL